MAKPQLPVENCRKTRPTDLRRGPFATVKVLVEAFSRTDVRRQPPTDVKTRHARLITIGVSHYCEKARWALDIVEEDDGIQSDLYYTEEAHPPAFASFSTVSASRGEWSASPMVVFDDAPPPPPPSQSPAHDDEGMDGSIIYDSARILQRLCPILYPPKHADEIIRFERDIGERLGPTVRCFAYHHLLTPEYFPLLAKIGTAHSSKIEGILFGKMLPRGLERGMRKLMSVNDEMAESSLSEIRRVFEEVSDKLEDGKRDYLFGSANDDGGVGFTAADLTFASLASPIIQPPELSEFYPLDVNLYPPAMRDLRAELRSTPAGRHVLNMYRYHRFSIARAEDPSPRIVVPKVVGRNRVPWGAVVISGCAVAAAIYGAEKWKQSKL